MFQLNAASVLAVNIPEPDNLNHLIVSTYGQFWFPITKMEWSRAMGYGGDLLLVSFRALLVDDIRCVHREGRSWLTAFVALCVITRLLESCNSEFFVVISVPLPSKYRFSSGWFFINHE